MTQSDLIVARYYDMPQILGEWAVTHLVSILGQSDSVGFPEVGPPKSLRLCFDDIAYSSGKLIAATREQIVELIGLAREWAGRETLLIHCQAGTSRSPAGAMIAAAALGRPDTASLIERVATARAYFRPNQTMLAHADALISPGPGLVDLARSIPASNRTDPWGPVRFPLTAPAGE